MEGSAPGVHDCMFDTNTAVGGGGGLYNNNSSPALTDCTFHGNLVDGAYGGGGAIENDYSSPVLTQCKFILNSSTYGRGNLQCGECSGA